MPAVIRAVVSLVALAGFFVFAFALIVGTAFVAFTLGQYASLMYWVAIVAAVTGLIVLGKLVMAAWARRAVLPGAEVAPEDAPELWALVNGLAQAAGTRGPDRIRLVGDPNASVDEQSRLFGLLGGPRWMYLGVPLLQGLSVTQLGAVLAHEFGHYSSAHTRLGPIAYRGRAAVDGVMAVLQGGDANWLMRAFGFVLRFPAGLYVLLSLAVCRSQEREADRLMVQVAGRAEAQAALREVAVTSSYWAYYIEVYVDVCWNEDFAPTAEGFFGGFRRLLDARADDLAAVREKVTVVQQIAPEDKTREDFARELLATHPPIPERIVAMESIPDLVTPAPSDDRSAAVLLPAGAMAATAERCYVFGYRERLEWDELMTRSYTAHDQRFANTVYEVAAELADEPAATLATVVGLVEADRAVALAEPFTLESERASDETAVEVLAPVVRAAVVGAGAACWRISWSPLVELVDRNGGAVDDAALAGLLARPATVAEGVARLTALGVDVTTTGVVVIDAATATGTVLAGFSPVESDPGGVICDVLVLDTGLILARQSEPGEEWSNLSGLVDAGSVGLLAARHRFISYGSMASAKVTGWLTLTAAINLSDGANLRLKVPASSARLSGDSDEVLKKRLAAVG